MKYRTLGKTGIKASILGFGAMRLPLLSDNPEDVDIEETRKMIDYSVEHGINIFDTALLYHTSDRSKPGVSETILGNLLNPYYDKVHVSTKMPSWEITSWDYFNNILDHQLEQLQKESIELFFVHSIKESYYERIKNCGLYEFIDKALDDGRIEHVGFSTHGSIELLNQILEDYNKWEFVLTQQNYLDTDRNQGIEGLKKLDKLGIGTMIMEPLRGGQLAVNQPQTVQEIFKKSDKNYKTIEWGFNYLWNKKEVDCVLSGMNNLKQVKENISLVDTAEIGMLDEKDEEILHEVREEYSKLQYVPCTGCNYCMPCHSGVDIPKCFQEYNMDMISGNENESIQYKYHLSDDKKAHNCVSCGICRQQCPQQINIPLELKKVKNHFGN